MLDIRQQQSLFSNNLIQGCSKTQDETGRVATRARPAGMQCSIPRRYPADRRKLSNNYFITECTVAANCTVLSRDPKLDILLSTKCIWQSWTLPAMLHLPPPPAPYFGLTCSWWCWMLMMILNQDPSNVFALLFSVFLCNLLLSLWWDYILRHIHAQ